MSTVSNSYSIAPDHALQAAFLNLVPRIQRHGQVVFRFLRCPHKREDAIAEMVALCWSWFIRLVDRGKDPTQFPTTLADFAARAVRSGRRLAGMERSKDVLSPRAQQRFCFAVEPYPSSTASCFDDFYGTIHGQRNQDVWEERLKDNTQTPILDQVAFRIDFPTWLAIQTDRNVRLAEAMIRGERTLDLAQQFGLSPGRISQIRQQLYQDYQRFHGEGIEITRA